MSTHGRVLHAISEQNLEELATRLLAYAASRRFPDPEERVVRAFDDAIEGTHRRLYTKNRSLFAFLCLVIEAQIAGERKAKRGERKP